MPFDTSTGKSDWVKLPKQGESYDYTQHGKILAIEKVTSNKGFNFTLDKPVLNEATGEPMLDPTGKPLTYKEDLGYRYEIAFEDGKKLSISQWKPYYAMVEAKIEEGSKMIIEHPVKGSWIVKNVI